jgi:DNA-directed RNA polymerase subunit RPC12/RpoP
LSDDRREKNSADKEREVHCGYCGSASTRLSQRGGVHAAALGVLGVRSYRCERCGRRFAFGALSARTRRHRHDDAPA